MIPDDFKTFDEATLHIDLVIARLGIESKVKCARVICEDRSTKDRHVFSGLVILKPKTYRATDLHAALAANGIESH